MKKLVLAAAAFIAMSTSASAFAALPLCDGAPRGQVCQKSATDGTILTSCGNGKFLTGAVRNAGNLEDGCFNASQAPKDKEAATPVQIKGDATKAKAPSPVKPKSGTEVRQPDPGSEGAEVGEEGSSGSSGSSR